MNFHVAAALELIALSRMMRANKRAPHHRTGTPSHRKRPYNAKPGTGRDINSSGYLSPALSTSLTKLQRAARKGQIALLEPNETAKRKHEWRRRELFWNALRAQAGQAS